MSELKSKYLENGLSNDDLVQFRTLVNSSSDSQIFESMQQEWENFSCDAGELPVDILNDIKAVIKPNVPSRRIKILRWTSIAAAALLIPFLLVTSVYYYNENANMMASSDIIVSTGSGERATITLPDGTQVAINAESTLKYSPHLFNKDERRIEFAGEAFFNVSSNKNAPFLINTSGLTVKVLGTSFNVRSRDKEPNITILLEQGVVLLTSTKTGADTTLYKNQQATLNKSIGDISISDINLKNVISWRSTELKLNQVTLNQITEHLTEVYGVKVGVMDNIHTENDSFSGTIPTRNLTEALRIIEKTYHLQVVFISESEILFMKK